MQEWMLDYLCCPSTHAQLRLGEVTSRDQDHVMDGELVAVDDQSIRYPIIEGVPVLLPGVHTKAAAQTLDVFGTEWQEFDNWGWIDEEGSSKDAQLQLDSGTSADSRKDFLLKTGFLALGDHDPMLGKVVVDAGCGNGRFSREAMKGAERVISVDASEAAHVTFRNMRKNGHKNVGVVRASNLSLPIFSNSVDYVFSIGVLQHTGNAPTMLSEMTRIIPPGKRLSLNCYGTGSIIYEFIDAALRKRTVKMSQEKKLRFARRIAGFDRALMRSGRFARSIEKRLRRIMMLRPTLVQMYDWYAPEIAEHYAPEDLRKMFDDNALSVVAALFPITDPDYDDRLRRKYAGSYCFLLQKDK